MLRARNLRKSFGALTVLDDVSLDLAPGTITTLIGPSGSGKSTLLRALALLELPEAGSVSINGNEYVFPMGNGATVSPHPWPLLTVVFQQLFLWPHLTLRQNIELPLRGRGRKAARATASEMLATLELEEFVDRYPNEASLGQRQLCAIGRALALRPRYLLLDEITSSLDVEYVARVLGVIRRVRDEGVAILIITHYIGFARRSADQVLFLDSAVIAERGTPSILDHPSSQRLSEFLSLLLTGV